MDKLTASHIIQDLRSAGWNEKDISDFILWLDTVHDMQDLWKGLESSMKAKQNSNTESEDAQFRASMRSVLEELRNLDAETDKEKRTAKMDKVLAVLQKTLEDYSRNPNIN